MLQGHALNAESEPVRSDKGEAREASGPLS